MRSRPKKEVRASISTVIAATGSRFPHLGAMADLFLAGANLSAQILSNFMHPISLSARVFLDNKLITVLTSYVFRLDRFDCPSPLWTLPIVFPSFIPASRPANLFRIHTSKQTPRFAVFWPKSCAHKSFKTHTYKNCVCNPCRMHTYKK